MDVMKYLTVLQALASIQAYRLHLMVALTDRNIGTREGQNTECLHTMKC